MRFTITTILLLAAATTVVAKSAQEPKLSGALETRDGVTVLRLWGTPAERGFAHGYFLAGQIMRGFERDLKAILGPRATTVDTLAPVLLRAFSFSKDEEAELAGILAGIRAKLPPEKRVLSLLGREISLPDLKLVNTAGDWYALGCSSAARWGKATKDGTPTVVRNFDFPALDLFVGTPLVLAVAGDGTRRGWVGIGHAGGVGVLTGMSDAGVFLSIHDVRVSPTMMDFAQPNVPRLLAMRRLLESLPAKGAVEAARDRLRGWPTLYGNNFMIATPEPGDGLPAGVLEYDTRDALRAGVDLRGPDGAKDGTRPEYVVCSNHHRSRAKGRCGRYDRLVTGCVALSTGEEPAGLELFALADRSAVPAAGRTVAAGKFGTIHQAVALTGARELWVRFLTPGKNIRDGKPVRFDVAAEVLRTGKR